MDTVFRSHRTDAASRVDNDATTGAGIFTQLITEWARLCTMPSSARSLRRWQDAEPALAIGDSLGQLLDQIDTAAGALEDEVLLALLRLAQSGQQLAGRVVLQAMLPKITRMVRATSISGTDNQDPEDRRHIAVATFWEVVQTYPTGRRRGGVAANLALDTLHRLTAPERRYAPGQSKLPKAERRLVREVPFDPQGEAFNNDPLPRRCGEDRNTYPACGADVRITGLSSDADLLEMLAWAVDVGRLTPAEASLLVQVYLPHPNGPRSQSGLAAQLGVTAEALRQRCHRARQRLIAAVRADAEGRLLPAAAAATSPL